MVGVGGMTANFQVTPAFGTMFILLLAEPTALFVFGSKRYIVRKVDWVANILTLRATIESLFCWKKDNSNDRVVACAPGFDKLKESKGGRIQDNLVTAAYRLLLIIPVQGFFIPVNLGVQQFMIVMLPMSLSMKHPKMWSGTNMVGLVSLSHECLFRTISILTCLSLCRSLSPLHILHFLELLPTNTFIHTLNRETSTCLHAEKFPSAPFFGWPRIFPW